MITTQNLVRRYGDFTAVNNVSFTAEPGRVTGFLGPNGAGKSTTMRVLTGLTPATSGSATVLGKPFKELVNPGRHVGVLLDASAQHNGRTGREVLMISAKTMGLPAKRVDHMMDVVGLTQKEGKRRLGNYSLGMRQRLGLANALMGDPRVLILDEPANGLDPAGIRWMRSLLGSYADQGGTVLLSSHLLNEIERIADDILVIGNGEIVARGTKEELLRPNGTVVKTPNSDVLTEALTSAGLAFTVTGDGGLHVEAEPTDVGVLAANNRVVLSELRPGDNQGLEEMFLNLTASNARTEAAA
ncbi:ATP-binding cassette domain-containing protein [Ornithinimicrobium sp. Arc0846-15]|nr:ATP-binding cassette domain-containing protein [Ornithinimicrobium laminariae]